MKTTIQPPPRHEILAAEFLHQHGAGLGLKATYQDGPWEDYADHDIENPNHKFDLLRPCPRTQPRPPAG